MQHRTRSAHWISLAAGAAMVVTTTLARADESQMQAAQTLHESAVAAMAKGNYDEACPKLEEVTRLVPDGLGAKVTLAECYEKQGKLASAWGQYVLVEQLAAREGQGERQRQGAEGAARLRPKLAYLTIKVPDVVLRMPQLQIKRGTQLIGAAQYNEAIPIDRGKHTVVAIAAGKKQWTIDVDIPADGATLAVEVPVLEDDPNARLTDLPKSEYGADDNGWMIPVGFAVGGAGVAALIAGGVLGGLAISNNNTAEEECPGGFCSAEGNDARRTAGTFADASTGLLVSGAVLAGVGVVFLALAPWDSGSETSAPAPTTAVRVRPGGLEIFGTFH